MKIENFYQQFLASMCLMDPIVQLDEKPEYEFDFNRMVVYELKEAYPEGDYGEDKRKVWAEKPIENQSVYLLLRKGLKKTKANWKEFGKIQSSYLTNRGKKLEDRIDGMDLVSDMI